MVHVFIIGGAGKIGQRLCRILSGRGHAVRALYRKPEQQALLGELGAEPVSGSLTELDAAALAMHFAGSDTVVFTAGAGGKGGQEMTNAVDGEGLKKSVAAALSAGVSRFLHSRSPHGEKPLLNHSKIICVLKKWPMWN